MHEPLKNCPFCGEVAKHSFNSSWGYVDGQLQTLRGNGVCAQVEPPRRLGKVWSASPGGRQRASATAPTRVRNRSREARIRIRVVQSVGV